MDVSLGSPLNIPEYGRVESGPYTFRVPEGVPIVAALDRLGEQLVVFISRAGLFGAGRVRALRAPAVLRLERGAVGHLLRLPWTQAVFRARIGTGGARVLLNCPPEGCSPPPASMGWSGDDDAILVA